jgi:hypothetical protein
MLIERFKMKLVALFIFQNVLVGKSYVMANTLHLRTTDLHLEKFNQPEMQVNPMMSNKVLVKSDNRSLIDEANNSGPYTPFLEPETEIDNKDTKLSNSNYDVYDIQPDPSPLDEFNDYIQPDPESESSSTDILPGMDDDDDYYRIPSGDFSATDLSVDYPENPVPSASESEDEGQMEEIVYVAPTKAPIKLTETPSVRVTMFPSSVTSLQPSVGMLTDTPTVSPTRKCVEKKCRKGKKPNWKRNCSKLKKFCGGCSECNSTSSPSGSPVSVPTFSPSLSSTKRCDEKKCRKGKKPSWSRKCKGLKKFCGGCSECNQCDVEAKKCKRKKTWKQKCKTLECAGCPDCSK